jgi:DNA polymerase-3 subunit alpha
MDFLGLRNLTVIEDATDHIRKNRDTDVDVDSLPLDDASVFKLLREGSSSGIFQMESPGMTRLLRQLRPDRFEEIAALIALYRPGPMEEIGRYVKGKHDSTSVSYYHPLLEDVLKDTNGVIVYQEQVTEILQTVAGFDPQTADLVRYAIGKKKSGVMVKAKDEFVTGCVSSGLSESQAKGLWELILPFAGYSFNRAHANGYALIAYQTAWLKAHYPVEYMAAVLTSVKNNNDRLPIYLVECRKMGIQVLPPDVNRSDLDFTPENDQILFGLSAIRNVGEQVSANIIQARRSGEGFTDFHDFCRRVDPSALNKKVLEALAASGAFDSMGTERSSLLKPDPKGGLSLSEHVAALVEAVVADRRSEEAGQFSLFKGSKGDRNGSNGFSSVLPSAILGKREVLAAEKEMLGFYVSEHPLTGVESALRFQSDVSISELSDSPDGSIRTVGGIITRLTKRFTKKGDLWYAGTMEDLRGSVEVNFWPRCVEQAPPGLLEEDRIVLVKARVDAREDGVVLGAQAIIEPDLSGSATPLRINLPATSCTPDRIEELKLILAAHPGPSPVLLLLEANERTTVLKLGGEFNVELRGGLFAEIKSVLGPEAVSA